MKGKTLLSIIGLGVTLASGMSSCKTREYLTSPKTPTYASDQGGKYNFVPLEEYGKKYFKLRTNETPILVKAEDMRIINKDGSSIANPVKEYIARPLKVLGGGYVDEFVLKGYLKKKLKNLPPRKLKEKVLALNLPTASYNGEEYYKLEIKDKIEGDYLPIALIPKEGATEKINFSNGDVTIINIDNILVYQPALNKTYHPSNQQLRETQDAPKVYIVKEGENLSEIANKIGKNIDYLKKINPQIKNINKIYPGEKINF